MPEAPSRFDRIAERILALKDVFARAGSVVASWRRRGERRFGPYYRVIYRVDGRQRAIYLGRSAEMAEKVRSLLAELKAPRLEARRVDDMLRAIKAAWRQARAEINEALRPAGMYFKGYELRGWYRWLRRQYIGRVEDHADIWWDNICLSVSSIDIIFWKNGLFDDQPAWAEPPKLHPVRPRHLRRAGEGPD